MQYDSFRLSLGDSMPPEGLSPALVALWWDARGDWHQAHDVLREDQNRDCAWVHAYLHRKEGDPVNAAFWYRRAGQSIPTGSLEEEWEHIAGELVK